MNKPLKEGKVDTTYSVFVADKNNLLKALPTPGTTAGQPSTSTPVRMLTVIGVTGANSINVEDAEHIVVAAGALAGKHNEQVVMHSNTWDDEGTEKTVVLYVHVDDSDMTTYYDSAGEDVTSSLPATATANAYSLVNDVLTFDDGDDAAPSNPVTNTVTTAGTAAIPETPHLVTHTVTMNTKEMDYGSTKTGVSAQLDLGALTLGLGYSKTESNDPADMMDAKTTYLGASGSIGDTGMGWRAWARNMEDHKGMESTPWGIGLDKALGGGANAYIEHANADDGASGTTVMGLVVNF